MSASAAAAMLLVAAAVLVSGSAGAGAAAGVDQTCELSLLRLEANTSNTLLLDTNAVYWMVSYQVTPGTRIRVTGQFPHARYMSWNLYDSAARPIAALHDVQLRPRPGSSNPFLPRALRAVRHRSYTMFVQFSNKPAHPAPNTLYAGTDAAGRPNLTGTLWYRIYVPDPGRDIEGGVPLPKVQVEPSAGAGAQPPTAGGCAAFQAPTPPQVNQMFRDSNGLPLLNQTSLIGYPGRNPPSWHLFRNFSLSFTEVLLDNAHTDPLNVLAHHLPTNNPSNPGIFSNHDIAYVYAATSQGFGRVLVLHGRAPTFVNTAHARRTPTGKQVRYFSMCEYEPATMRVIDCARDNQTALRHGYYTYVISTPQQRPANAIKRCGVTWIAQGPQSYGLLILRNMLASRRFKHSIQQIRTPGREKQVMGAYYPRGSYLADKRAFEKRGCPKATTTARPHGTARRRSKPAFTG